MIYKNKTTLAFLMVGALNLAAQAAPTWVNIPVEKVYVPMGFDSNDNVQVIVSGNLPNLCYKSPKTNAVLEEGVVKVSVEALYEVSEDTVCAEAQVPFLEKVSLQVLDAGEYKIQANNESAQFIEEKLLVKAATNVDVNDHVYARVDYVERKDAESRVVLLKGYNPSDCFELEKIEHLSNEKDTLSVQPIMKKIRNFCPLKMVPFEYPYEVPAVLEAKEILLHVRTMQGDSVNTLFLNKSEEKGR